MESKYLDKTPVPLNRSLLGFWINDMFIVVSWVQYFELDSWLLRDSALCIVGPGQVYSEACI